MRLLLLSLFLIITIYGKSQDLSDREADLVKIGITLSKIENGKTKHINNCQYIQILTDKKIGQDSIAYIEEYIGSINHSTEDSVVLNIDEKIVYRLEEGHFKVDKTQYSYIGTQMHILKDTEYNIAEIEDYDSPLVSIPKSDVKTLRWFKSNSSPWYGVGATITGFSVVSALLVAPLASINYKNSGFNEKRYYKIAGYSLSALTVSVPMMLLTKDRDYHLKGKKKKWAFK